MSKPNDSQQGQAGSATSPADMNPGDQAPPGSAGTGENICPKCGGKGSVHGQSCEHCGGTGKVIEGVGGA